MSPILVTGATGTIGTYVVHELRQRGVPVRAFVRDPARAAALLGERVELAVGDLADPASIRTALDGAERVFLCDGNQPQQVEHETNVIDAAAEAGVNRLVKLSANGAQIGLPLQFWDAHGRIEQHLRASGLPSVVLRPSTFTSNLLASAESIRHLGQLFAPAGDGKVTLIDPRDVAAVAVAVLTEDGHEGRSYLLTGPAALTYHEVAREVSDATGRTVQYVDVPDAAAREAMVRNGLPERLADQLVVLWGELRRGAASTTTDVVRVLTGCEPRSVADFARDFAPAFLPDPPGHAATDRSRLVRAERHPHLLTEIGPKEAMRP